MVNPVNRFFTETFCFSRCIHTGDRIAFVGWQNWLVIIALVLLPGAASASNGEATSLSLQLHVQKISATLAFIADEMGVEQTKRPPISVTRVSPREVYFQATTLYDKSAQLMFEFTSEQSDEIETLMADAGQQDVLDILILVEKHLDKVTAAIGGRPSGASLNADRTESIADIFQLIVDLNRKVNNLLDYRYSPSNVHQKVTEAISVASAILGSRGGEKTVFYPDRKQRKKRPRDIYHKIASMYDKMIPIMEQMGKTCLILGDMEKTRKDVLPSDVYDLAVLVVSQLKYMHSLIPDARPIRDSYYPGKVLPSDVYQRLTVLEKQIDAML